MYYRASGVGSHALIFVHGWYQNGLQAWAALATQFEKKYRIFAPDLPGHGLSDLVDTKSFSLSANRELLAQFVRYLKSRYRLRSVVLIGHSYGAFAVLDCIPYHARDFAGVVALAAIDDYAPYVKRLRWVLRIPRFLEGMYFRIQALLGFFPYGDRQMLYAKIDPALMPSKSEYGLIKNRTLSLRNSRAYMRAFMQGRVEWPAKKVGLPTLLVYGERDNLTPSSWADRIMPHLANGQCAIVEKAGHNVQITGAAVVGSTLRPFFEKCFRRRA